jgi:hypothetical protein
MGFREAVENTPTLEQAYQPGLQALRRADSKRISCRNKRALSGSVDLDGTLASLLPNDPRWDYGIGLSAHSAREKIVWIEVHPASSLHVGEVLKKLDWLKGFTLQGST